MKGGEGTIMSHSDLLPSESSVENESDYWIRNQAKDKKLEDEYLLGDVIGRGNSSIIHKCLRKGRTEWACKILKKKHINKKTVNTHIKTLLELKHPNIINLKEVFETQDEIQMIEELARGGELFERIVERGHYSEEDAAKAVRNILKALQYLHSQGITHRDLKPENLLYQTEFEESPLKVSDFAMDKLLLEECFNSNRCCGAFGYYAPEVLQNQEIDSSVDLWSLGVITYIMLCGFEPFWDEAGEAAMSKKIIRGDYNFPPPWWDEISDSAKELISKLLSVDPKSRPTAEEALNHPWTLGINTPTSHMNQTIIKLKEFNARRRFRVATTAVIATRRALNLLSPTKKSNDDKSELKCFCNSPKDGRTNHNVSDVNVCCDCSTVDSSVCNTSNELSALSIDGGSVGKNSKMVSELSEYKENYVGLG